MRSIKLPLRSQYEWMGPVDFSDLGDNPLPDNHGVYLLTHDVTEHVLYVGKSQQEGGINGRTSQLYNKYNRVDIEVGWRKSDEGGTHYNGGPVKKAAMELSEGENPEAEISLYYTTPAEVQGNDWRLKGLEAAVIAKVRPEFGHSPLCFKSRPRADPWLGPETHAEPLSWVNVSETRSQSWMQNGWWNKRARLASVEEEPIPEYGVYRVWRNQEDSTEEHLLYIGEGECQERLENHRKNKEWAEDDCFFSAAPVPSDARGSATAAKKRREDIEMELIGAHFVAHGIPPLKQFGEDGEKETVQDSLD